ncbi:MAG: NAD(P)H-binding protein [Nitriliruptor sp.]|uniref:SDR family oxidoreductase n=1 Tax=Nitriliruptor sp. TaxID=2448056 RepID=UPI0034A0999F
MTSRTVLVTGAGGKTGRAVIAALGRWGVTVRAFVRDADRVADLVGTEHLDVEVVVGDQRRVDDLTGALDGVDAVYAIAPNVSTDEVEMGGAIVAACRNAGVNRLVFHSVIHPQLTAMPHHRDKRRAEEMVITSGLDWTVLQPNAYLQNLAGYTDALRAGRYEVPYATDSTLAMVDLDDVAEVAARLLVEGRGAHRGVHATFELSGPAAVSPDDVAATAAEILGRDVTATRQDPGTWAAGPGADLPDETRARLLAMFRHYDRHGSPGDPTVLTALLDRQPRDLDNVLPDLLGT